MATLTEELRCCSKCRREQPLTAFYKQAGCTGGRRPDCSACQRGKAAAWHLANRERHRARSRAYHATHRDQAATRLRRRHYGLTAEAFEAMRAEQDNACAICKREFTKTPYVDHCHTTGKVRGLLCNNCNRALGWFREDRAALFAAVRYLNKHQGR